MAIQTSYKEFKTYNDFSTEVINKLDPHKFFIKYSQVAITFAVADKENNWLATTFKYDYKSHGELPSDNRQLYDLLITETETLELKDPSPELNTKLSMTKAILSLPYESEMVQKFLKNYREGQLEGPLAHLKENINTVHLKYQGITDTKRLCKKEIVVVYFEHGHPEKEITACFEKNYERKCNNNVCQKWKSSAHKLFKCTQCRKVWYCNKDCQRKDWSNHKVTCKATKTAC